MIQLYIRDEAASRVRPVRELKDYKKIFLKAHEETTVEFFLEKKDLAFWHEGGQVYAEEGEFTVFVGNDPAALNFKKFVYIA